MRASRGANGTAPRSVHRATPTRATSSDQSSVEVEYSRKDGQPSEAGAATGKGSGSGLVLATDEIGSCLALPNGSVQQN